MYFGTFTQLQTFWYDSSIFGDSIGFQMSKYSVMSRFSWVPPSSSLQTWNDPSRYSASLEIFFFVKNYQRQINECVYSSVIQPDFWWHYFPAIRWLAIGIQISHQATVCFNTFYKGTLAPWKIVAFQCRVALVIWTCQKTKYAWMLFLKFIILFQFYLWNPHSRKTGCVHNQQKNVYTTKRRNRV